MRPGEGIYLGDVVHTRVRTVHHKLRYRVFAVLFDCTTLDALDRRLRLFSRNRFNLLGLYDRDHGDGTDIASYLDDLARQAGMEGTVSRFLMLCYPRVLGYAFNPLTVYYGLDDEDRVCLVVYEVNNTFGERKTYVLPAAQSDSGTITQSCAKRLQVSPFNGPTGTYSFHLTVPLEEITVGVALRDEEGPVLKAHFHGRQAPLTDAGLLRAVARTGWMTVKVTAGIHYEALKLWMKGLRLQPRTVAPKRSVDLGVRPENADFHNR
ncbi:DUF1365 domain-containing protein [Oricola thermophila]|nr:DUF1365 domain-containing protein [Oricola thermophila]